MELLHTASLVHDDTVDRAALRRGRPTLNSVLSSGAVILLGDYLFAQSAMLAAATDSPRIVSIFASTLADICDGQLREMFVAHRLDQTREEYDRRIFGKTASLFAGAAEMGAIIGKAHENDVQALRQYGSDVGMAFQIVDDVLDLREGIATTRQTRWARPDPRHGDVADDHLCLRSDRFFGGDEPAARCRFRGARYAAGREPGHTGYSELRGDRGGNARS